MPGEPIQIGPFVGGLNTFSDQSAISDNQVVVCENFENDVDGSLRSRPPIYSNGIKLPLQDEGSGRIIGSYTASPGTRLLIASDGKSKTYYFDGTSWALVTDKLAAVAMVQFDGKAWLLSDVGDSANGGYWTLLAGFVEQPNLPHGRTIVSHKMRLWVARGATSASEGTRMYYSKPLGQPDFWPAAPDYIDIGAGDGQNIVALTLYYNTILIWRTESIYSYNFGTDPVTGIVSPLVPGVGLDSADALAVFESSYFFIYADKAYEFANNRVQQINSLVAFKAKSKSGVTIPTSVSIFNKRVIFSYYDTLYVYSMLTKTWSTWYSTQHGPLGKFWEVIDVNDLPQAVVMSTRNPIDSPRTMETLNITDGVTGNAESMVCTVVTKNYNYEATTLHKKMFHWAFDAQFRGEVTASATPIGKAKRVTWGQAKLDTWGSAKRFLWGSRTSDSRRLISTFPALTHTQRVTRRVEGQGGFRFLRVGFRLEFKTDGSDGLTQLYSLMTYVSAKQTISSNVS